MADFKPSAALIILISIVLFAIFAFAIFNSQTSHAAQGPSYNRLAQPFVIEDQGNNVSEGGSGRYEHNFLRAGNGWVRDGDYPGDGDDFEACQDGQIVTLWVYAHNTINPKYNHNAVDDLDFQGSAIAENATVSLSSDDLNEDVYENSHTVTATLDADNASVKTDTTRIFCNNHPIALVSEGVSTPIAYSWANEPTNRDRHVKAQKVFGAEFSLTNPSEIFGSGSQIGYDGNLPACRYYAAYVKVQLKVVVESAPEAKVVEPEEPKGGTGSLGPEAAEPESATTIARLGSDSENLTFGLVALIAGFALAAGLTRRAIVARAKRNQL